MLLLLLFSRGLLAFSSEVIASSQCHAGYTERMAGPIQLDASTSSEVLDTGSVDAELSGPHCVLRCHRWGCAAAIVNATAIRAGCRLLMVLDASRTMGPPGSHVARLIGSGFGVRLWLVDNFEQLINRRRYNWQAAVANATFANVSTGRYGSMQKTIINVTGCYLLLVGGAKGGDNPNVGNMGGHGALVKIRVNFTAGMMLGIVVGQAGGPAISMYAGAGGGGGSFVYTLTGGRLLAAAGGGGGASLYSGGSAGEASTNGSASVGIDANFGGEGGTNGQAGVNTPANTPMGASHGGCGAGWLGGPTRARRGATDGDGGGGPAQGWIGGAAGDGNTGDGGFGGGGGGGAPVTYGSAGGGGGFSGGGAGLRGYQAGGGGGSFALSPSCVNYATGFGCAYGAVAGGNGGNAATGGGGGSEQHGFVSLQLVAPFVDVCPELD